MSEPANYFDPSSYLSTDEQLEVKALKAKAERVHRMAAARESMKTRMMAHGNDDMFPAPQRCIMAIAFELGDQMEDCPHYDVLRDRLIAKIRALKATKQA